MTITPDHIEAYKTILLKPSDHDLPFRPFGECFVQSDVVVPQHILAKQYLDTENVVVPKLVVYLLFQHLYGNPIHMATNGDLGYKLNYKPI